MNVDSSVWEIPYDSGAAVRYARKWSFERNPLFPDFGDLGGDCTNFISQCVLAGCPVMNRTPTFGWYYASPQDRAPAWSGVEPFFRFMTGDAAFCQENGGTGPYGEAEKPALARIGDVVQLGNEEGAWYHSLLITGFDGDEPLLTAHTNDALDRPLSSYSFARSRFLRIIGGRIAADTEPLVTSLTDGKAFATLSVRIGEPLLLPTDTANGK